MTHDSPPGLVVVPDWGSQNWSHWTEVLGDWGFEVSDFRNVAKTRGLCKSAARSRDVKDGHWEGPGKYVLHGVYCFLCTPWAPS